MLTDARRGTSLCRLCQRLNCLSPAVVLPGFRARACNSRFRRFVRRRPKVSLEPRGKRQRCLRGESGAVLTHMQQQTAGLQRSDEKASLIKREDGSLFSSCFPVSLVFPLCSLATGLTTAQGIGATGDLASSYSSCQTSPPVSRTRNHLQSLAGPGIRYTMYMILL